MINKFCKFCKEHKDISCFGKDKLRVDGLSFYCKNCNSEKGRLHKAANPYKVRESKFNYCEKNRNKEAARSKKWRDENPERHKENIRRRARERSNSDTMFRLRKLISKEINRALKKRGKDKEGHSCLIFITYSIEDLISHIESLFEPWMNWDNQGIYVKSKWNDADSSTWTWQIDHIIPHSTFKYVSMKDDEFKKCWALDNLRPLSAKENLLKRDKVIL